MDRHVVSQVVAMIVVLWALLRWLPVEDPADPIGRGDPLRAMQLDENLAPLSDGDRRAYLLALRRPDAQYFTFWRTRLRKAETLLEHRQPDTLVQFKGVPRNVLWPIMYYLYPVPTVGVPAEDGSTEEDETLPGVTDVFNSGLIRWQDLSPEQLQEIRRQARKGSGPVPVEPGG
jgi:hypothetical protein